MGIVGRTAAGRSSLFKALFRTVTAEQSSLNKIDEIEAVVGIAQIEVAHFDPQDAVPRAVLFSDKIRFNLGPFDNHCDDVIWTILESVELFDFLDKLAGKLERVVKEVGSNFSQGQSS